MPPKSLVLTFTIFILLLLFIPSTKDGQTNKTYESCFTRV